MIGRIPSAITDVLRWEGTDVRRGTADQRLVELGTDLSTIVDLLAVRWAPTRLSDRPTPLEAWLASEHRAEPLLAVQAKLTDEAWMSQGGNEALDILEARASGRWLANRVKLAFRDIVACTDHLVLPSVGVDFRREILNIAAVDAAAKARVIQALSSCPQELGFWARRDAERLAGAAGAWTNALKVGWPRPEPVQIPTRTGVCHALALLADLDPGAWFRLLGRIPVPQVLHDLIQITAEDAPHRLLNWIGSAPEAESGLHPALVACVEVAVRCYLHVDERLAAELRVASDEQRSGAAVAARRELQVVVEAWLSEIRQQLAARNDGAEALRGLAAWCTCQVWGGPMSPRDGAAATILYAQAMVVFGDALVGSPALADSDQDEQEYFALALSTTLALFGSGAAAGLWQRWVHAVSHGRPGARHLERLPGGWTHDCLGRLLCSEPDPLRRWTEALHWCMPGARLSGPSGSLSMFVIVARSLQYLAGADRGVLLRGAMEGLALYLAHLDTTGGEILVELLPEFWTAFGDGMAGVEGFQPLLDFAAGDPELMVCLAAGLLGAGVPLDALEQAAIERSIRLEEAVSFVVGADQSSTIARAIEAIRNAAAKADHASRVASRGNGRPAGPRRNGVAKNPEPS